MIYITGDMHGRPERFKDGDIKKLKKGDTLIVAGDFGFVWDGSKAEEKLLKHLGKHKYNILFVPGTNDNYTLLEKYPMQPLFGAQARCLAGNVNMLMNGAVYTIEGKKIFVMGGGTTDDTVKDLKEGINWWRQEQPPRAELEAALENLKAAQLQVDYIVTHDAPATIRSFILMNYSEVSNLNYFLEEVSKVVRFRRWYFGYYHIDRIITPSYTCVYNSILRME